MHDEVPKPIEIAEGFKCNILINVVHSPYKFAVILAQTESYQKQ